MTDSQDRPSRARTRTRPCKPRPDIPTISDERLAVLMAAHELIEADCLWRAPTIRNLARAIGRAKSTIHGHLLAMREQGIIDGDPHVVRGYRLTVVGQSIIEAAQDRGVASPVRPGFIPVTRTQTEQHPNR